ncbi:hypothetical protein DFH11DRAFT_1722966 [Phellopilus nigrolimitatus]|nr:hypothetical protein DFH11DRAFT_1722966 [Phellopilus nigrolimitatus]
MRDVGPSFRPTRIHHVTLHSHASIQSSARHASTSSTGPYARAVLSTPLGDLARDVDASELGLFTLAAQPAHAAHAGADASGAHDDAAAPVAQKAEVVRVEFPGATPLRRPRTRLEKEKEKEPEVYAEAALKYLDRYHSIRPMPRARQEVDSIIERLNCASERHRQADRCGRAISGSAPTAQDEEKRIQELNLRIKQMRIRKEVLLKKQKPPAAGGSKPSGSSASKAKDKDEDEFWSEPVPRPPRRSRARQSLLIPPRASADGGADDSLLLSADMDMGAMINDVSMDSLVGAGADAPTPLPAPRAPSAIAKPALEAKPPAPMHSRPPSPPPPRAAEPEASDEDEGEQTIVLAKAPALATPPPMPFLPPLPESPPPAAAPAAIPLPSTPPRDHEPAIESGPTPAHGSGVPPTPGTGRKSRVRVTSDVERIVTKIWSTVGDVIMPGHPFNTASAATTNKPPRAKETMYVSPPLPSLPSLPNLTARRPTSPSALLQNLAAQTPPPSSPSALSHSTFSLTSPPADPAQPSAHQILTAHLLLALINAPPKHAMPLAAAKAALAAAGLGGPPPTPGIGLRVGLLTGGGQALETRALYGCVAKRLLKIDRGGREQTVRFDV